MGKRKSNISGLSGLARHVFDTPGPAPSSASTSQNGHTAEPSTRDLSEAHKDDVSETQRHSDALDTRPKKKAKLQTGLLGPGLERYDATGLVPFYTDASQVPEHLEKCTSSSLFSHCTTPLHEGRSRTEVLLFD